MNNTVFSATADGLEFLSIHEDGTVTTRHRREDGVIHWHRQRSDVFPSVLRLQGPVESWRAQILPLPLEARTPGTPLQVAVLFRKGFERLIPFAFPFVALSDEAIGRILHAIPAILVLVHDNDISCTRDRYELYRDIEESAS